ncbi:hypothetical protein DRQ18_04940 [bacterium]|nr:MAG: hypothetical protein DRQ18_04940 [bacterium]
MEAREKIKKKIEKYPEVNGVGIKEEDNEQIIVVYLSSENKSVREKIPQTIEGIKIKIEVVGEIKPL